MYKHSLNQVPGITIKYTENVQTSQKGQQYFRKKYGRNDNYTFSFSHRESVPKLEVEETESKWAALRWDRNDNEIFVTYGSDHGNRGQKTHRVKIFKPSVLLYNLHENAWCVNYEVPVIKPVWVTRKGTTKSNSTEKTI